MPKPCDFHRNLPMFSPTLSILTREESPIALFHPIDAYCERLDPSFWAEPINALTNLAFVLTAGIVWVRLGQNGPRSAYVLCLVLALIGVGSFLFHTVAQGWAAAADTLSILVFVLIYLYAASRDYLELPPLWCWGLVVLFIPFTALLVVPFSYVPILSVSAAYLPIALLIAIYAVILRRRHPATARGLALGAGSLFVSITLRSLDLPLCHVLPIGTHFTWHILNAIMLAWMIEVYRRHMLAPPAHRR